MSQKHFVTFLTVITTFSITSIFPMLITGQETTHKEMEKERTERELRKSNEEIEGYEKKQKGRFKITKAPRPLEMPFEQWCEFVNENWYTIKSENNEEQKKAIQKKGIQVLNILNKSIGDSKKQLKNENLWFSTYPNDNIGKLDFDINKTPFKRFTKKISSPIIPYVEKLIVPKNSHVYIFGDLHGNFDALKKLIKNLIDKNVLNEQLEIQGNNYLIFLGDYQDRGTNGLEILLTLFRLKMQNPEKIILIRGNHEQYDIIKQYGFFDEIKQKFRSHQGLKEGKRRKLLISTLLTYELMPITVFLGYESETKPIKFIQLSHGLIDHKYNPKEFLDSELPKNSSIQFSKIELENFMDLEDLTPRQPTKITYDIDDIDYDDDEYEQAEQPESILTKMPNDSTESFRWSDISIEQSEKPTIKPSPRGSGFLYNAAFLKKYFDSINSNKSKITNIIRGHEHNLPAEIRFYDKIGAVPIGNLVYTVMSGIYTTPGFNWGKTSYNPTFLELTPPKKENTIWDIKIKYLKDGKEKTDTKIESVKKIQSFFKKNLAEYKKRKNAERKKLDEEIEKLNLNTNLAIKTILQIKKKIPLTDKNNDSRTELVELIKDENLFGDDSQSFAEYILNLKYKANSKRYLDEKLVELINKEMKVILRATKPKRKPPPIPKA